MHTKDQRDPVQPEHAGLFGRKPTYFGFLPAFNEGQHNFRPGLLVQSTGASWPVHENNDAYEALAELHMPHVVIPPGRFQVKAVLEKMPKVTLYIANDQQLQRSLSAAGGVAWGLLATIVDDDGGGVLWI